MAGAIFFYQSYADRKYLQSIEAEIAKVAPLAQHADDLDRKILETRQRSVLLDQFRNQTRHDMDAMNELTRLIEPPAWVNNTTLSHDSVMISGEAPQAAPLLKILDSSPLFSNSAFQSQGRAPNGMETFQIRATRRYPGQ